MGGTVGGNLGSGGSSAVYDPHLPISLRFKKERKFVKLRKLFKNSFNPLNSG